MRDLAILRTEVFLLEEFLTHHHDKLAEHSFTDRFEKAFFHITGLTAGIYCITEQGSDRLLTIGVQESSRNFNQLQRMRLDFLSLLHLSSLNIFNPNRVTTVSVGEDKLEFLLPDRCKPIPGIKTKPYDVHPPLIYHALEVAQKFIESHFSKMTIGRWPDEWVIELNELIHANTHFYGMPIEVGKISQIQYTGPADDVVLLQIYRGNGYSSLLDGYSGWRYVPPGNNFKVLKPFCRYYDFRGQRGFIGFQIPK